MNHKIPTYHKRSFNVKDVEVKKYYLRKAITQKSYHLKEGPMCL